MTNRITNTAAQDPLLAMLEMTADGADGAVERQEARGQAELVQSEVLPTSGLTRPAERAIWESMGLVIGEPVNGDTIFTHVTLPAGWSKKRTDHSMWSDLVDDKGRKRAAVFYKAAFYDRPARINVCTRFAIQRDWDSKEMLVMQVLDGAAVRFSSGHPLPPDGDWQGRDRVESAATAECVAWLDANGFSDFKNPTAYWD